MNETTIISYSRSKHDDLMCLAEGRSRYLLPFGGRFRVVDFTIRNAVSSGARKIIIYNDNEDNLHDYVSRYGELEDPDFPALRVISREFTDVGFCYSLVKDCNTPYYIIFNGDNPSVIDFKKVLENFKKSKSKAVLYKIRIDKTASMANTVLVTERKNLLKHIETAKKQEQTSPNIFEMIINRMINRGVKKTTVDAHYWSMNTVPEYYAINMRILKDRKLSSVIYHESSIRSYILGKGMAEFGRNAKAANSIISDNCKIYGTVMDSIIFPGVEIGENTVVRDSIILPNIKVGMNTRITKTIIDEGAKIKNSNNSNNAAEPYNIGHSCVIGTTNGQLKNNEYPNLNGSLTLIGKNCIIPDNTRIGGACYIASGKGAAHFEKSRHLYDGLSILN